MTEFERELVKAFNRFFDENGVDGIAYRRKQHRFSSQFCDVLVDSKHPRFYLAIENKSIKTSASNKLYFSQHFSESDDGHQVDRISNFVERSGRRGYLAVELKRGRGKQRKGFMIPWDALRRRYEDDAVGIPIEDLDRFYEIDRSSADYSIGTIFGESG
jgi:Holliday junction resolvase